MPYRRVFKGFCVGRGNVKDIVSGAGRGDLFDDESQDHICSFKIGKAGDVSDITWHEVASQYEARILSIGRDHHNQVAQKQGDVAHLASHQIHQDSALKKSILEHGLLVLVEDHLQDARYQSLAKRKIIARTSADRIAEIPGDYSLSRRTEIRDAINQHLPDNEEVLEIINDRYLSGQ